MLISVCRALAAGLREPEQCRGPHQTEKHCTTAVRMPGLELMETMKAAKLKQLVDRLCDQPAGHSVVQDSSCQGLAPWPTALIVVHDDTAWILPL